MYKTDILIIGAGVIGLAIAEELGKLSKSIVVVERNKSFGMETSSRNSEVIHGGIYYPPGSLKAELCVRGRDLLYTFCARNGVPYKKTGKLIVATEADEIRLIEELFRNGVNNGVSGLKIIDREDMKVIEPAVDGVRAIYSPETGIVDSHRLMQRLMSMAKSGGVTMVFGSEVTNIKKDNDGYKVTLNDLEGLTGLSTVMVINCAGLDSDLIAEMAGIDIRERKYELEYCKGQYFRVNQRKSGLIKGLIYPIPHPRAGVLGIHATPDLGGGLRLGPDHEFIKDRAKDYSVDPLRKREFYLSIRRFLPFIEEEDISVDTAGIRPKLKRHGSDFRDFVVNDEGANGFPGLIDLIGIESPGLTASLAIAEYVRRMVSLFI